MHLNSTSRQVHIGRFYIDPQLPEDAFIRSLPKQEDRFDFSIKGITISKMDFPALFNEEIFADSINVETASFKIYRDLDYKRGMKGTVKLFPHQSLLKIPVPFLLKKLVLANTFIEYKKKAVVSRQAGRVQFYHTHAVITNLTNRRDAAILPGSRYMQVSKNRPGSGINEYPNPATQEIPHLRHNTYWR